MKPVKQLKKVFFRIVLLILSIVQLCSIDTTQGQIFTFDNQRKKDVISFKLVKNLIIVPLYINGKGPYNFIVDTGVSPLIITDPSILDSIDLKTLKKIKIKGLGDGDEIDALLSNAIHAKIGHASISRIPSAIFKNDVFNLSNYLGMHIHGLIGSYFFNSFLVKIKYPSRRLIYYLPDEKVKKKGERIPIEMINDKPYINCVTEMPEIGSVDLKLIIDLGASHALSLESFKEKTFPLPALTIPGNLGMGIGGLISGNLGRISSLKIGKSTFHHVLTAFPRYEDVGARIAIKERNGNLGANVLKHFNITFDYKNLAIYLKPNKFYKGTFEHDMSGMEVYVEEDVNRYFIGRIEPGSPAAFAGILTHDEIISINLLRINQFSLDEICDILKSGEDKKIIIELVRDQKVIFKIFKLKIRV